MIPHALNPFGKNNIFKRKLNYLLSTGTQVIKTDWYFPSNCVSWQIKAKFQCNDGQPVAWPVICGANNSNGGATDQYYKAQVRCGSGNYASYSKGGRFLVASHDGTSPNVHGLLYFNDSSVDPIGIITLDMKWENQTLTANANNIILSDASTINKRSNTPLYIFALCARQGENGNIKVTNNCKMKLYYFQLLQDDKKILDFIPVLDLNNTPCMLDKVQQMLYYNQGTGQFLYG